MKPIPPIVFDLIPILVVVLFPVTLWSLAKQSGWAALAKEYASARECAGFILKGRRGRFGKWMGYKGILNLGVDREGFFLSVPRFFRIGHPPLFFPWKELRAREEQWLLRDWVVLEFSKVPGVSLGLARKDALLLQENGGIFNIPAGSVISR